MTDRVLTLVESSLLGRAARAAVERIGAAYSDSHSGRAIGSVAEKWRAMPAADRRSAIGLTLITAAVVHVGLQLFNGAPPSWLWAIVPALTVAHGLLQMLAAGGERMRK